MQQSATSNPYAHMKRARQFEQESNVREAEREWKQAVAAADRLPLAEYNQGFKAELARYEANPSHQTEPGVTLEDLRKAYAEVLSLPFCARIELAGFYGRCGAYPEALDVCRNAFSLQIDSSVSQDPFVLELVRRARALFMNIEENVAPEEIERIFAENMHLLDRDGNGFVHQNELRAAQFDLNLSPECQQLIRHLLTKYFEVEASSDDEWGIDISGISIRDIKTYAAKTNADWKRMGKKEDRPSSTDHVW